MPAQTLVATPDPEPRRRRSSKRGGPTVATLAAFRIPAPGDQLWPGVELHAGTRVTFRADDGAERFGTIAHRGGIGDFRMGAPGVPPTYQAVPVAWDDTELVDVTRLSLLDDSDDPGRGW